MNQKENLASLSRRSSSSGGGKKKNLGSLLLLLVFLAGVALVFVLVFGKRLQPRVPVTVAPVLLLESEAAAAPAREGRGAMLAQASGWIEPDPFSIHVPVKVDGFVEEVFVYAGDTVERGQLLATLDSTNHALRVDRLTASLELARQRLAAARAEKTAAEARHLEAEDRLERIQRLDPADRSEVEVVEAERTATATLSAVEAREADRSMQEAQVALIQAELTQAEVDLARTRVTSPMDGVILNRYTAPGMKRMARMDDPESSSIVSLYDPERLQVRVDVPLSDAGRMVTGMPAKVVTAALADRVFSGRVTRITGEADITRNTLQVKVALEDPDPALRPEMLCRVEFFAPASTDGRAAPRGRQHWIAEGALDRVEEGNATVWVVDPVNDTVSRRAIEVGAPGPDELRPVYRGLRPGEQVVVSSQGRLQEGTRVAVSRE